MLTYAIDNPAPSTIFLITGDRDFAYALSVLKNRHYKVVLVKRPNTHVSLTFQACVCLDWFNDVVNQAENPQRSSDPVCNASPSHQSPQTVVEVPLNLGSGTEGTADMFHDKVPDRVPSVFHPHVSTTAYDSPRQDQDIFNSPTPPSSSTRQDSMTHSTFIREKPQQAFPGTPKHQCSRSEPPYIVFPGNASTKDDSTLIKDGPVNSLLSNQVSRTADTMKGDVLSSISPLSSPFVGRPFPPPITPDFSPLHQRILHEKPKPDKATVAVADEKRAEAFLKEPANNVGAICPSSTNPALFGTSATTNFNFNPSIKVGAANLKGAEPMNAKPASGHDSRTTSQTTPGHRQLPEPLRIATPVVPQNFVVLVEALQRERSRGVSKPLRGTIAERIGKKGTTYQKAGVSSFRAYCILAEQAGIVEMGGKGGKDWICLLPKWHDVVTAPTTTNVLSLEAIPFVLSSRFVESTSVPHMFTGPFSRYKP